MDLSLPDTEQVSDAPPKVPKNIRAVAGRLKTWLETSGGNHLKPVDPNQVLVRPLTAQERAQRELRLRRHTDKNQKRTPSYRRKIKPSSPPQIAT